MLNSFIIIIVDLFLFFYFISDSITHLKKLPYDNYDLEWNCWIFLSLWSLVLLILCRTVPGHVTFYLTVFLLCRFIPLLDGQMCSEVLHKSSQKFYFHGHVVPGYHGNMLLLRTILHGRTKFWHHIQANLLLITSGTRYNFSFKMLSLVTLNKQSVCCYFFKILRKISVHGSIGY